MSEKTIAAVETVEAATDVVEEVTGRTINTKALLFVGVGVAVVAAGTFAFLKIRKARKVTAEVTEEVVNEEA